jgi:DNA-binding PadR family transcriptional regulator
LSLAEWLVLCLVSKGPTHGFAIAGLLAQDGSLGQVWYVDKTVVYRATQRLEHLGLITVSEKQPSRLGLDRAQMQGTPAGRQAAGRWLRQPTIHPRNIRSELLVKLALLDRAGADPADLLRAQRRQLALISATLASQRPPPDMTTL